MHAGGCYIKAIHSGPRTNAATSDDAGGLDPVVHIAQGARVMLTLNLSVDTGLVNGPGQWAQCRLFVISQVDLQTFLWLSW